MVENQKTFDLGTESSPEQKAAQIERDSVREEYLVHLAEKLKDPAFRAIEGFPIGTDEAILALSDPPYYTACPNPFIGEWLEQNSKPYDAATDTYHREPFAADVLEGKNDPIYNAHSYHTKVPHKAIMRYILHYTEPGDVVYDGFCGTGMTGVAAQMCGNKAQVESLGYCVDVDGTIRDIDGTAFSKLGVRNAILNDLSPVATFITYNYNTPVDVHAFEREAKRILAEVEAECGWMYSAIHDASEEEMARVADAVRACQSANEIRILLTDLKNGQSSLRDKASKMQIGRIDYTVWSDIFVCSNCGEEIIFYEVASQGKLGDKFACTSCRAEMMKRSCDRAMVTRFDVDLGESVKQPKRIPVLVHSLFAKKRYANQPNEYDNAIAEQVEKSQLSHPYPVDLMMGKGENWGDTYRSGYCAGVTHVHHFYTRRALASLSVAYFSARKSTLSLRNYLLFAVEQTVLGLSRMARYVPTHYSQVNQYLSGTIYFGSLVVDPSIDYILGGKVKRLAQILQSFQPVRGSTLIQASSATAPLASASLDYIFTDPPFGSNLQYSELNFLWESWLQVKTNNKSEAVANNSQKKGIAEYQCLMQASFSKYYDALKPGRWMTVEFHNSANSVWNSIQEGLQRVGFVVADVRILDKQTNSFNAQVAAGAVNQDLVISCYKPRSEFEIRFCEVQGKPESAVEFVRQHLSMLPVAPISKGGRLESVAERHRFRLFDRMIAYHLQKGAPIPLDAAPFYKMLEDQFTCRDDMYFLPEQAARYDALIARGMETEQLSIFVQDEKSAVQWVRAALSEMPLTLGDVTPKFMQELQHWPSHEPRPELRDLLSEYFIKDENTDEWRVPDPDSEKDIEQLRRNALLKQFRDYTKQKGPLKVFRKEALVQGFTTCYETNQFGVIVAVCEKIPEKILQEIQELVMFYDIAKDSATTNNTQPEFVFE